MSISIPAECQSELNVASAQYLCLQMVLNDMLHETIPADAQSPHGEEQYFDRPPFLRKEAARTRALEFAYQTATHMRAYREAYGFKVFAPYAFQHATFAIFILLGDLIASLKAQYPQSSGSGPVTDTVTAFEVRHTS